jgi:hypothetical protein
LWLRTEGLLRAGGKRTLAVPLWAWREASLRVPQLRQDGIYVARCVYTRRIARGSSLTDRRTMMDVAYYRFVRFLDGRVALMRSGNLADSLKALKNLAWDDPPSEIDVGVATLERDQVQIEFESKGYLKGVVRQITMDLEASPSTTTTCQPRLTWLRYFEFPKDSPIAGTEYDLSTGHFAPFAFRASRVLAHLH